MAELEGKVGKKATKRDLSKKLGDLKSNYKNLKKGETGEEGEEGSEAEAKKASGKGIVAVDEIQRDALGNYDWFQGPAESTQETRRISIGDFECQHQFLKEQLHSSLTAIS